MNKALPLLMALWMGGTSSLNAQTNYSIWFDRPATVKSTDFKGFGSVNPDKEWESKSLPVGNGSIGANILGGISTERITFNEKSLWAGGPNTSRGARAYWDMNKESAYLLPQIREAFKTGDYEKAAQLTEDNFNGKIPYDSSLDKPFRFGNYTTMGAFNIFTGFDGEVENYRRELLLDSALVRVSFDKEGQHYTRTCFISYPQNVMIVRFRSSCPDGQNLVFSYQPNPEAEGKVMPAGGSELLYSARLKNNKMAFAIRMGVKCDRGTVENSKGELRINGAGDVTFFITADTDYCMNMQPDFQDPETYVGVNPLKTTEVWMKKALALGYDRLLKEHYKDYSSLFERVKICLNGKNGADTVPSDRRLMNYRKGIADNYLEELYYQYGRYLLIASSRAGNLPANLQGIWHNAVDGPWRVDYHNNINLQMNYWPALSTNLGECVKPLVDFIRMIEKPGKRTAAAYFGARGWTASISSNIFGFTAPLIDKDMSWNFNPMAGPWLATHLWEYYDYTRDRKFLEKTAYPLLKGSADFAVDYLWKRADGSYTAAPSTSPEHGPIDEGATFVHAVIREILADAIEASRLLGCDAGKRKEWENVLTHLAPYKIGRYGQLMEWSKDIDDPEDHHRHVNHLFGLHPGHTISPLTTPELAKAARVVLEHRGDGATGWSMGWKLNQWARLQDGNHAYLLFQNLLKNGTLDNLWDSHPPFQIDGNFGGTAGVTEMLLQSNAGVIQLLPALPDAWKEGSISGLCAKGNFEVAVKWTNHRLTEAEIYSKSGGKCVVQYGDKKINLDTKKGKRYHLDYSDFR